MKESILAKITKCPDCGCAFIKENGEICNCPEPADFDGTDAIPPEDLINDVVHAHAPE